MPDRDTGREKCAAARRRPRRYMLAGAAALAVAAALESFAVPAWPAAGAALRWICGALYGLSAALNLAEALVHSARIATPQGSSARVEPRATARPERSSRPLAYR